MKLCKSDGGLLRRLLVMVAQAGERDCIIFTWGRGREGQLGTGAHADSAFPQPVGDLQGRQVLQVRHAIRSPGRSSGKEPRRPYMPDACVQKQAAWLTLTDNGRLPGLGR